MKKSLVNLLAFVLILALMLACNIVVFADTESDNPTPTTEATSSFEDTMIGKTYIVNTGNHKNLTVKLYEIITESKLHSFTFDCEFDENNIYEAKIFYEYDFNIYSGSQLLFHTYSPNVHERYISTKTFTVFNTLEEALNDKEESEPTEPSDSESSTINLKDYPDIYPGDADGNCKIDVNDVTNIQKYVANSIANEEMCLPCSDINGDGKINIKDATETQRKIVGLDYNSFVYPEEYLCSHNPEYKSDFLEENAIESEEIITTRNVLSPIRFSDSKQGIYLITSTGEFLSAFGYYKPCFNEEFFEEKALVIKFIQSYDWETEFAMGTIGVQNNTLYVHSYTSYSPPYGEPVSPAAPVWMLMKSVNQKDIAGVEAVANISNRMVPTN